MKKPDLSIIIVNYNTKELLKKCLESIFRLPPSPWRYEVIVVDNNSSDGSVREIRRWKRERGGERPELKLVENKKNLGFARANNLGLRKAGGEFILFLNPDTIVPPKTIPILVDYLRKHPRVGVVTCRVELPSGELDDACRRGFPTPWNAFCHFAGLDRLFSRIRFFSGYTLGYLPADKIQEIDACCGAFFLTRKKILEEIGSFDEKFFWYGEDLDLCFRIKQRGYKIIYYPKVKIIHYKGASSGLKKSSREVSKASRAIRKMAAEKSVEAMKIFYRKHYRGRYPFFVDWLVNLGIGLLFQIRVHRIR